MFLLHISFKTGHTNATTKKEDILMNCNCNANKSIACTVNQCVHHCDTENYCSLSQIQVGTHEANPTVDQCTDCMSFEKK